MLWLIPFGAATGAAVYYDTEAIQDLGVHPSREDHFNKLSDYAGYTVRSRRRGLDMRLPRFGMTII